MIAQHPPHNSVKEMHHAVFQSYVLGPWVQLYNFLLKRKHLEHPSISALVARSRALLFY